MEKAEKAEKQIEQAAAKVGCSEDGALWVKQSLDPFNDMPRRGVGYPDTEVGKSVIQTIRTSYQYTTPSAQDVHIFLDTIDTPVPLASNSIYGGVADNYSIDAFTAFVSRRGGLQLRAGAVGATLTALTAYGLSGGVFPNWAGLDVSYTTNSSVRVLSKAFEVHNTTPTLSVGGSVCTYRAPGDIPYGKDRVSVIRNKTTPSILNAVKAIRTSIVPETLAAAMLYPDSQQWAARDGCYVVAVSGAQTSEVSDQVQTTLVLDGYDPSNSAKALINAIENADLPVPVVQISPMVISPFYLCGAYLTGLPAGSTLTINLIYIIERFVDSSNKDLVVLGNPSPCFDPVAIELYSRTAMRLPTGTKVKNNADGDWIKTVADVLGAFGVPGMPLIKGAVDIWNTGKRLLSNEPDYEANKMKNNMRQLKLIENGSRPAANPRPPQKSSQTKTNNQQQKKKPLPAIPKKRS